MDFSFFKMNIEKIGLKLKSIVAVDTKVDVEVNKQKVEIETLTQIQEQKNLNAPITNNTIVLVAGSDQAKELVEKITGIADVPLLIPPNATGEATLPEIEEEDGATKLLKKCLEEYAESPEFLLDRGRLLFFYDERQNIDFKEDALVFLLQSSLKAGFPFWYWTYLYREKFGNVVPLLEAAFRTDDVKIRLEVLNILTRFLDTAENIVQLAMTENNELVLGAMVVKLVGDPDRAQRVIANAISRKLIPRLDYKEIKSLTAPLGKNEKKFLTDTIASGWSSAKVKALNILSVTASEEDLPLLEGLLQNETYRETTYSTLHCIARIGKTNIAKHLEKELEDARLEELYMQVLETLVAVKDKGILPKLFSWLKDGSSGLAWRFTSGFRDWTLSEKIKEAILELMDKDFYEVIVHDILAQLEGKYQHVYVWRQFNLLRDVSNEEIVELIKKETRLSKFEEWSEVLNAVTSSEAVERKDKDGLLALAVPTNYTTAMLSLRELWKLIPQDEALKLRGVIENFRKDLVERLRAVETGEYPQEQKELSAKGLDNFVGENGIYNRHAGTRRKKKDDDEKDPFSLLMDDIYKFERIEDEYFGFLFEKKSDDIKAFLIEQIGRPYEKIYDAITSDWMQKEEVETAVQDVIANNPNNLLKLPAIGAATRMGMISSSLARAAIQKILEAAKTELNKHGITKDNDKWLLHHNTYYRAINTLSEIGDADDLSLIEEATDRETVLKRHFYYYSSFHDIRTVRELYRILDTLRDDEEKANLYQALDSLDYKWTKELLSIDQ
jgi:hypothetical protein